MMCYQLRVLDAAQIDMMRYCSRHVAVLAPLGSMHHICKFSSTQR